MSTGKLSYFNLWEKMILEELQQLDCEMKGNAVAWPDSFGTSSCNTDEWCSSFTVFYREYYRLKI